MSSKKVVFVTGGSGYIGSHCVLELLNNGYDVITVDNMMNSRSSSLRRIEEMTGGSITFYQCDLTDGKLLHKIFAKHKIDSVIHFAASKNVAESMADPFLYYKNNLVSTINLVEAMTSNSVFEMVFSSSCSVYGDAEEFPIKETHPTGKVTCAYGRTKYITEEMLKDLTKAEPRWNIISLRYFNPIGAHESGRIGEDNTKSYTNIVPLISQVAVGKREVLSVFGGDYDTTDGTAVRDYIHVVDLVEGHVTALKRLQTQHVTYKVYNLGLGDGLTVLELIKEFEKASGKKVSYNIEARRPGDVARLVCDPSLAKKELGWVPKRTVANMCEDFWRWQSLNPNGYADEVPYQAEKI